MRHIYADHVVLPEVDEPVPACVELDGGRILAVYRLPRPTFEADPRFQGALDLGPRLLTPAFVNAHTHLAMGVFRGLGAEDRRGNVVEDLWFALEQALTPADVHAFARVGALECVLSGQGAVYDHYYHAHGVARALMDIGLEGVVAETLQDLDGPASDRWKASLDATEALCEDTTLAAHGIAVAAGPHATDTVSDLLWARILEVSRRRGLPLHLHLAQSADEVRRARDRGFESPVQRLLARGRLEGVSRTWLAHGIFVRGRDRQAMNPDRDVIVHCPLAQTQFAFPARAQAWRDVGVRVVLGTDAGACNDGMDVQRELGLLAHGGAFATSFAGELQRAFDRDPDDGVERLDGHRVAVFDALAEWATPRKALRAVWEDAGSLHPDLPVGRIAPGCRASLCAWSLEHPSMWPAAEPLRALAFGAPTRALHTVIVGGRVLGEVGRLEALLDSPEVQGWLAEASRRRAALLERVTGGAGA